MRRAIILVALLALAGCTPPAPTAAPTSVPAATLAPATVTPAPSTATAAPPAATATPAPSATPPAPTATVDPYAGWLTYTNSKYGFFLRYPAAWTLKEEPSDGRISDVVKLSQQTLTLIIGFKRVSEDLIIEAGMPAGDLELQGNVTILGTSVPRKVLVFEGKDKAVYYNSTTPVQVGDLQILVGLQDFRADYATVAIPQAVQDEADLIAGSLALTQLRGHPAQRSSGHSHRRQFAPSIPREMEGANCHEHCMAAGVQRRPNPTGVLSISSAVISRPRCWER